MMENVEKQQQKMKRSPDSRVFDTSGLFEKWALPTRYSKKDVKI